jgi:hypothetical protein
MADLELSIDTLSGPGALMAGVSLLAAVLLELQRHSEILAEVERREQNRLHSQAQRDAARARAGYERRPVGRPRGSKNRPKPVGLDIQLPA